MDNSQVSNASASRFFNRVKSTHESNNTPDVSGVHQNLEYPNSMGFGDIQSKNDYESEKGYMTYYPTSEVDNSVDGASVGAVNQTNDGRSAYKELDTLTLGFFERDRNLESASFKTPYSVAHITVFDESVQEEDSDQGTLSNKRRQKNARERKKKYYAELEQKVKFLEAQTKELSQKLEECREKIYRYESQERMSSRSSTTNETITEKKKELPIVDEVINYINQMPDEMDLKIQTDFADKYGPYGQKKIELLDSHFNSIIENLIHDHQRICLAIADRQQFDYKQEEFIKYGKMKKFERNEKFPDPFVRQFIERHLASKYCEAMVENISANSLHLFYNIKIQLKKGVDLLYKAREEIYRGLIQNDMRWRVFLSDVIQKRHVLHSLKNFNTGLNKVSDTDLWGLEFDTENIEETIQIRDLDKFTSLCGDLSKRNIGEDNTFHRSYELKRIRVKI